MGTLGFTLSKFPIYILYIFNWIPYKLEKSRCSCIQAIITAIVHVTGLILIIVFIYGYVTTATPEFPAMVTYVILTLPIYLQITAILFLCNMWMRKETRLMLESLNQQFFAT